MIRLSSHINLALCLICFMVSSGRSYAQDLFDAKNSYRYGCYLLAQNRFEEAEKEFSRSDFLAPGIDSTRYYKLLCLRQSGRLNQALVYAKLLPFHDLQPFVQREVFFAHCHSDSVKIAMGLLQNSRLPQSDKVLLAAYPPALSYQWKKAGSALSVDGYTDARVEKANRLFYETLTKRRKKEWIALSLSAVVPGLGKVYAGRWKDAIFSFVFFGGLAFQSYRGFDAKGISSARGWVFGALGTGFYLGNLYGTHKVIRDKNLSINRAAFEEYIAILQAE